MSYSQPNGYRMPSSTMLPSITRALQRFGWGSWLTEAVRATGQVAVDLLNAPENRDDTLRRLSNDAVGEADLVISRSRNAGVILQAAEFLDVAHAMLARPTAVPLQRSLDLRARAQFMDDPGDPDRAWTYVLFGTEQLSLERSFAQLRGIELYPVPAIDGVSAEDVAPDPADTDRLERTETWARVLAPYARAAPLSVSAPEPGLTFALMESMMAEDQDEMLAAEGQITVSAVVQEVATRLGDQDLAAIEVRLMYPIQD